MTRAGGPWPAPSRNASPSRATRPRCNGTRALDIVERLARKSCRCAGAATTAPIFASTRSIRLSRDFWPFPDHGVETDDAEAPPLPGNEPKALERERRHRGRRDQGRASRRWARPPSRDSPICRSGAMAPTPNSASIFPRTSPASRARTARHLSRRAARRRARARAMAARRQVTDLSLSAIEEPGACASPSPRSRPRSRSPARSCASRA